MFSNLIYELSGHNNLWHRFVDDDVVGPVVGLVIGSQVFDLVGRLLPHPLLTRSAGTEREKSGQVPRVGRLTGCCLAFDAHQVGIIAATGRLGRSGSAGP